MQEFVQSGEKGGEEEKGRLWEVGRQAQGRSQPSWERDCVYHHPDPTTMVGGPGKERERGLERALLVWRADFQ